MSGARPKRGAARRAFRAISMIALFLVAGLVAWQIASGTPGRAVDTIAVLLDMQRVVGSGPMPPLGEGVTRETVRYQGTALEHVADRYLPANGANAALVVIPGASPEGKDDPRFAAFAGLFARAGFEVLAPDILNLRRLRIGSADAEAIADAVAHLSRLRRAASPSGDAGPIGVVAISYAVGPTVLALLRPDTRDRVGLMVGIGGYHSNENLVSFFTTGKYRSGAGWRPGNPHPYGKWVFALSNADLLRDRRDRILLTEIARLRWRAPDAPVADLIERLGPEAMAVIRMLENRDPNQVHAMVAQLPAPVLSEFRALDLKHRDLSPISARAVLVHGRDDRVIPSVESETLAAAWPRDRVSLHLLDGINHVTGDAIGIGDIWEMFLAIHAVLRFRDALRIPDRDRTER